MLTRGRWLGRGRSLLGLRPSIRHSLSGRCGRSAPCAGHLALPSIGCVPRSLSAMSGPTPVWDSPEAAISRNDAPLRLQPGTLHKVVWMCWTGTNPMPAHLRLCLQTVRKNSGLEVILVTPDNLAEYVPDPHPGYKFLHLAHRADYLRCYLLHNYGGIYLDCDTIVLKSLEGLFDALEDFDAVGYDGSPWGEFIGISDMGPFKPGTELTNLWFAALHGKLEMKMPETESKKTDVRPQVVLPLCAFKAGNSSGQSRTPCACKPHAPPKDQQGSASSEPCTRAALQHVAFSGSFVDGLRSEPHTHLEQCELWSGLERPLRGADPEFASGAESALEACIGHLCARTSCLVTHCLIV
eukprot:gnl/TRDRNA2_/TRDRNA2_133154_c0_seq2.p1 gnl/TRDRNA2_/TRDRNA2_133154_c0~~gnl/TRDRNA2_/TRDRNA2_133154_c0_seq2.p1  ORF type:complete len:353 (-),score=21.46 gnl/TRDRNA2_/TRDRNA2_133154_c0_seq2:167-1225(-)